MTTADWNPDDPQPFVEVAIKWLMEHRGAGMGFCTRCNGALNPGQRVSWNVRYETDAFGCRMITDGVVGHAGCVDAWLRKELDGPHPPQGVFILPATTKEWARAMKEVEP